MELINTVDDLKIVWGDDPRYWHKNGEDMVLHRVCWFDVRTLFEELCCGEWDVVVVGERLGGGDFQIDLLVGIDSQTPVKIGQAQASSLSLDGFVFGSFEVFQPNSTVELFFQNHSQQWKGGISIKQVKLAIQYPARFLHTKPAHSR